MLKFSTDPGPPALRPTADRRLLGAEKLELLVPGGALVLKSGEKARFKCRTGPNLAKYSLHFHSQGFQ